jgi:putative transposase
VEGGLLYHALNRANARLAILESDDDDAAFERALGQATSRYGMRLLAYCLMPNHFHLLLGPRGDGDLSDFMRWLSMTHTQRWHAHHRTAGTGHLYQGRYKSIPVQSDEHFLTVCRYVERNALRAGLVERAEDWRWGSLSARRTRDATERPALTPWPIERPRDWTARVNRPFGPKEEEALLRSIRWGQPFGSESWRVEVAARRGLESVLRPRGRPRKRPENSPWVATGLSPRLDLPHFRRPRVTATPAPDRSVCRLPRAALAPGRWTSRPGTGRIPTAWPGAVRSHRMRPR